jgi:hypothetical protein
LKTNLDDTGGVVAGRGEDRREIEVVRDEHRTVRSNARQYDFVRRV